MRDGATEVNERLHRWVAEIMQAYLARNPVSLPDLPVVIDQVAQALAAIVAGTVSASDSRPAQPNAMQIEKSVQHDGIVSFVDGKIYKSLKRHIRAHGLSPTKYRMRYGLPPDYPMIAPAYSEVRSAISKKIVKGQLERRLSDQSNAEISSRGYGRERKDGT